MKLLLLIFILTFTTVNDYDNFLNGKAIGFKFNNVEYSFYKVDDYFQLDLDSEHDVKFYLKRKALNKKVIISNEWGEFRFHFKKGILENIVQKIYKSKKYNVDSFTINFEL